MSYNRKTWTNRNVEHPYRRTLTDTTSGTSQTVDVTRAEGTITAEGDTFDANTMNNMEGRIADQFSVVDQRTGALTDLETTEKSSLVAAINEVAQGGGGGGSSTLAGLTDTSISSPSNGQVLKYNSTSSKWENAAESGGGTAENYIEFEYTNSSGVISDIVPSHWTYVGVTDQNGDTVALADIYNLVFTNGYSVYLKLTSTYAYTESWRMKTDSPWWSNNDRMRFGFHNLMDVTKRLYCVEIDTSNNYEMDFYVTSNWRQDASDLSYDHTTSGLSATDAQAAIDELADEKADLASPAFTGNPTAPTQSKGNSSTRIATTAFVNNEIDNDTKFHKNDTVDLTPAVFAGRIDSDKKTIQFTIPLNKPLGSDITGVTTGGNFSIYTPSGAIFTSSTLASKGTVTHYLREYGIGVRLVLTTAYSTGSTPVSVYCNANNSMTFTGS